MDMTPPNTRATALRLVKNSMGKVINLPVRKSDEELKVLYLQNFVRTNILCLVEQRKKLIEMQTELRKLKAKLTLRIVENDDDGTKS